jgi:uncharacterized protein YqeY
MTLKDQLQSDLKQAMLANDTLRKNTLRMALAAIKLAEIEKKTALDDPGTLALLQKEVKSRREAMADAQRANRPDLVTAAEQEIGILESYLPKAISQEELDEMAKEVIQDVGATSLKEMGLVMKALMPKLAGRATGDQISQTVRRLLG